METPTVRHHTGIWRCVVIGPTVTKVSRSAMRDGRDPGTDVINTPRPLLETLIKPYANLVRPAWYGGQKSRFLEVAYVQQ